MKKKRRGNALNQPLVDPHLECVPRLAALAVGRLARGDLEHLRRQAHGALDAQIFGLGALNQLAAHLLQRLHLARRQGDADLMDFLFFFCILRIILLGFHSKQKQDE